MNNKTTLPKTAIYVHGLASGAYSLNFKKMTDRFPQFTWAIAEYGESLAKNVEHLNRLIAKLKPSLIVGTSMGGLTLLYADAPNATKVVHNPALSIADCVRNTIGLGEHPYKCRRLDKKTTFVLTEEMCQAYEAYIASHTPSLGRANYAIFSAHDELLGDAAATRAQEFVSSLGYKVVIDPEGVHSLTPSTIDLIAKEVVDKELFWGIRLQ